MQPGRTYGTYGPSSCREGRSRGGLLSDRSGGGTTGVIGSTRSSASTQSAVATEFGNALDEKAPPGSIDGSNPDIKELLTKLAYLQVGHLGARVLAYRPAASVGVDNGL